jgi:DNA (cytosine-5)-methyltransferase 1
MFALDFFCGAGGLTRGFLDAGVHVVAGIDVNVSYKRTYQENNRPAVFVHSDLRTIRAADLARYVAGIPREDVVFTGCAPCQPFSKQRREVSRAGSTLLAHFGRLVHEFQPGFVLIENVPGLATVPGNSTYRRFLFGLETLGYQYADGRLDAKCFGVPQTRNRWVLIASRFSRPTLPEPTNGPALLPYETVRRAIAHYPTLEAGEESIALPNHRAARLSETNLRRMQATPINGGGRLAWPDDLVLDCHRGRYNGHSDVYGRMHWDMPAPALTCRCYSVSNGRYGHPEQDRGISLREAASLQSFPDDYIFYGRSQAEIGAQIGNAVPVRMAEALARKVLELRRQARTLAVTA